MEASTNSNEVVYLYLDDIIPNRFQPREIFDDQALKELAVSIREHGVIQPIIVRKVENKYEIIAGERRYKASTMAGLTKIPAIVKNLDDKESSKVALIENLQRKDLSPIEEARTYQKILELENDMTQEQLAATMGKTQSSVSNKLRLLALPDEIQDALLKEKISERHARSLLNVEDKNTQIKLLDKVIAEKMTVRELDKEIKSMNSSESTGDEAMNGTGDNNQINNMPINSMNGFVNTSGAVNNQNIQNVPVMMNPQNMQPMGGYVNMQNMISPQNVQMMQTPNNNMMNGVQMGQNIGTMPINQVAFMGPQQMAFSNPFNGVVANNQNDVNMMTGNIPSQAIITPPQNQVTTNNEASNNLPDSNPTIVDINKMRENAVDIAGTKNEQTHVDVNELMKDTNASETREKFKFIPSFHFNSSNTQDKKQDDGLTQLVDSKKKLDASQESTNLASSIKPFSFSVGPSSGKDVSVAINDIKNTIRNLRNNGYIVSVTENDTASEYQISISLKKGA